MSIKTKTEPCVNVWFCLPFKYFRGQNGKKGFFYYQQKMKNKKCHATFFAYLLMKWKNSQPFQLDSYEEQ